MCRYKQNADLAKTKTEIKLGTVLVDDGLLSLFNALSFGFVFRI